MSASLAAVLATILFLVLAGFQATLALGAPLGAHVLGGRNLGVLPPRQRIASGVAAGILVVMAVVILARAAELASPNSAAAGRTPPRPAGLRRSRQDSAAAGRTPPQPAGLRPSS